MKNITLRLALTAIAATSLAVFSVSAQVANAEDNGATMLLWGDTHVHSNLSVDAYVNRNTTVGPDTSYRFAKGMPVIADDNRAKVRLHTPLDFMALTDHAEYWGIPKKLWEGDEKLGSTETGKRYLQMIKDGKGRDVFLDIVKDINSATPNPDLYSESIRTQTWYDIVDAAERHNEPGVFTALIGWEWSALPNGANLHRVVFMPQGADVAKQFMPYSAFDSDRPEDFWAWLDKTSKETGAEFVAIPHGSNISNALMFQNMDSDGNPISPAYARARMRWEPVAEITQIKGDSETHPELSPDDEFADFETYEHLIKSGDGGEAKEHDKTADYVRSALMRGLEQEQKIGVNPYKFGIVGSTDTHTGLSSAEEPNFWGKFSLDSTPDNKDLQGAPGATGWDMSAAGLAAVWATENTRQALIDAFKRKEVYGTSGPRIQLRVFGGWDFSSRDAKAADLAEIGYKKGVPMGGELSAKKRRQTPSFLIHAAKDPLEGNLDRVQMVKGWTDRNGVAQEKVYNLAWSGDRKLDARGKLRAVGNTVNLETGAYTNTIGTDQLLTVWEDPDFDAAQRAFYYVRVLQIPTPRHTLLDAIALQRPHPEDHPSTIQERAYSSPIWYTPKS